MSRSQTEYCYGKLFFHMAIVKVVKESLICYVHVPERRQLGRIIRWGVPIMSEMNINFNVTGNNQQYLHFFK